MSRDDGVSREMEIKGDEQKVPEGKPNLNQMAQ